MNDMYLINALTALGITLLVVCPFIVHRITKYRIEIEKIRQEAEVRKEEIRCRNQLELEKFMISEQKKEAVTGKVCEECGESLPEGSLFRDRDARPVDVRTAAEDEQGTRIRNGIHTLILANILYIIP